MAKKQIKDIKTNYLWEHYLDEDKRNVVIPDCSLYEYMMEETKDYQNLCALNYFGNILIGVQNLLNH